MPRLDQVAGHGAAHVAEADEGDPCHDVAPSSWRSNRTRPLRRSHALAQPPPAPQRRIRSGACCGPNQRAMSASATASRVDGCQRGLRSFVDQHRPNALEQVVAGKRRLTQPVFHGRRIVVGHVAATAQLFERHLEGGRRLAGQHLAGLGRPGAPLGLQGRQDGLDAIAAEATRSISAACSASGGRCRVVVVAAQDLVGHRGRVARPIGAGEIVDQRLQTARSPRGGWRIRRGARRLPSDGSR